jgi:hypothetical protein
MESVVQVDFKVPKMGSAYSHIINEGCHQALMGMAYRNPYEGEIERKAFDYGFQSGSYHKDKVMG